MDKTNLNEQLYIVSLDNGIRREEPITINVLNSFKDGSQLVQLNNSVLGVYKSNTINEQSHLDDYEIIKTDIAELLDIDHEEAKRIVTEENNASRCIMAEPESLSVCAAPKVYPFPALINHPYFLSTSITA